MTFKGVFQYKLFCDSMICACTLRQGRQSECNSGQQKRGRWLTSEKCDLMWEEAVLTMMFTLVLSKMKGILAIKNL